MHFRYFDYFIFFLQLIIAFLCILSENPWICFAYGLMLIYFVTILLTDSVPFDQVTINCLFLSSASDFSICTIFAIINFSRIFTYTASDCVLFLALGILLEANTFYFYKERIFCDMIVATYVFFEGLMIFLISWFLSRSLLMSGILFCIILSAGSYRQLSSVISNRNNNKGLFYITRFPFTPIYHINMDADGFVRGCSTVKRYDSIPCSERKMIFDEELLELKLLLKPGRMYVFETYGYVIKKMKENRINGKKIYVIKHKKALFPELVRSSYYKLYSDKWKFCKGCEKYSESNETGSPCELGKSKKRPYVFFLKMN